MKMTLVLTLLNILTAGCASRLVIVSQPEGADIYARQKTSNSTAFLGKAPLTLTVQEVQNELGESAVDGRLIEIVAKMPSYQDSSMALPVSRINTLKTKVDLHLLPDLKANEKIAHRLIQYMLSAQNHLNQRAFAQARSEVEKALELDQEFIWAWMFNGYVEYMENNFPLSIQHYKKVLSLDPNNSQAIKMIANAEKRTQEGIK